MLYNIFDLLVNTLKSINLVEYWKSLFWLGYNRKLIVIDYDENLCRIKGKAIDYFIIMKYGLLLLIFKGFIPSNKLILFITWYMLLMNIFTYFYYHVWENRKSNKENSVQNIQSKTKTMEEEIETTMGITKIRRS